MQNYNNHNRYDHHKKRSHDNHSDNVGSAENKQLI